MAAMSSGYADRIKKMNAMGKGKAARQSVALWGEIRKKVSCAGESVPETGQQNGKTP
ncbi:MAG: hypothetical protein R2941_15540 [Desulfobacterales bacterium]